MNGAPTGGVTVTFTVRAWGSDTTIANGECCASRMHTFVALHVKFAGHVLPGGSHRPATAVLPAFAHAIRFTFFAPGAPQLAEPCTPSTSVALSRSAAQYSQPM